MIRGNGAARYRVRLSVPRVGGQRTWGPVSGDFERRLAAQASAMVSGPHVDSLTRRGRDYLRVMIAMTVTAADPAQALTVAWRVFRRPRAMTSPGGTRPVPRLRSGRLSYRRKAPGVRVLPQSRSRRTPGALPQKTSRFLR
jgi:hypothetical protein